MNTWMKLVMFVMIYHGVVARNRGVVAGRVGNVGNVAVVSSFSRSEGCACGVRPTEKMEGETKKMVHGLHTSSLGGIAAKG